MNRKNKALRVLISLVSLIPIFSYSAEKPTCAVLPFRPSMDFSQDDARFIGDRYSALLSQQEVYTVLGTAEMQKLLEVQKWNMSDYCSAAECAVEAGKMLSVQYVIFGSVGHVGSLYSMNTSLIDVESSRVTASAVTDISSSKEEFVRAAASNNINILLGGKQTAKDQTALSVKSSRMPTPDSTQIKTVATKTTKQENISNGRSITGAASESRYSLWLSLGLLNGEAKEHVYDNDLGYRRQLSRLDWDLKSVAMGGLNGSVRLLPKLTLNGGVWVALTEGNGEMDDYDWLDTGSTDWTHYSLSDVDVTEGSIFDLNVAWDLVEWEGLTGRVCVGYKQDDWQWEDHGVYLLYPEYGYIPQDLNGENMINYEQRFQIPYLGASADWTLGKITVSGRLMWSPIVTAEDWDDHVARSIHFHETFEGGDLLGLGLEARYDFTEGFFQGAFLTAAVDYQQIDLIVGDMDYTNGETGEVGGGEDVAGIENSYAVVSVGGGLRF